MLCEALGLEFYIGPPRGEPAAAAPPSTPALERFSPSIEMTVRGWAKCSIGGYLEGEKEFREMPMPLGLEDADAFYAMALGASMKSEGIENGDYCVVSPNTPLAPGLRVWLKNHRDQVTIKRLLAGTETHYELLGWQDPDEKGTQAPYYDQWLKSFVKAKGVVLAVYRGRPNVKNPPPLIPDPKAPAARPKGARALEAADAVGQRFTDEALRKEISTLRDTTIAMREENKALREATEAAFKELTSQLSQTVPKKLEDDSALVASDKVIEFSGARQVAVRELDCAAGAGAEVLSETVKGYIFFHDEWLLDNGLNPDKCSVIRVKGESMEPLLPDGCAILVDHNRRHRRAGHVFVVRGEDGLVVKKAGKDESGNWRLLSEHPGWKPVPWPRDAEIIGEVKWLARKLP